MATFCRMRTAASLMPGAASSAPKCGSRGPKADIHSGLYGGLVQNPLHIAGAIIGSFHDDDGPRAIARLLRQRRRSEPTPRKKRASKPASKPKRCSTARGSPPFGAKPSRRLPSGRRSIPTLDVNGMWGGYQGAGNKTIIPAEAGFKVTLRLAPDQDPRVASQLLKTHIESFATETASVSTAASAKKPGTSSSRRRWTLAGGGASGD